VEAFGDHLGAYEDVDLAGFELEQGIAEGVLLLHGVRIDAGGAGFGEEGSEGVVDAFRAVSCEEDAGVSAFRAFARREFLEAADVADEAFAFLMERHGNRAVGAADDVAAGEALDAGGKAPAVDEEDGLFGALEALVEGDAETFTDDGWGPFGGPALFVPHVDDADEREAGAVGPFRHAEKLVFAAEGIVP
jgi:hypothetical protein